jgi:hypothetical protein
MRTSESDSDADTRCGVRQRFRQPAVGLLMTLAFLVCGAVRGGNPAIEGVPTSIAAFLGTASDGPPGEPVLVTSFAEHLRTFGEPAAGLASPWLAPSVAAFFANGGRRCWVVRVADAASDADFADGLAALGAIDEIGLVGAPGATSPAVQAAVIAHCEAAGDRIALLDAIAGAGVDQVLEQRAALSSPRGFAVLYHPWLRAGAGAGAPDLVPPCGFVAGALARSDLERGVWEAPAASLVGAIGLAQDLTSGEADALNVAGVGMLRAFVGQGIRIWGVRTIADDQELKYVPVRRLLLFLEESIHEGTSWAVFEPNDEPLWTRLRSSTENFLTTVWRAGALQGTRLQEAFFVRADATTMTQADLDLGRTVILVGVATLRPAEFTLLRIVHQRQPASPPFRRGDPNGDGVLDLSDAVRTLAWLFLGGSSLDCREAADANADGVVDISDATFILAWLFLGGPAPAAPFPGCGPGPVQVGCESSPAGCG